MLRPEPASASPPEAPLQLVLICGSPDCRRTFAPDPATFTGAGLRCPHCGDWIFQAALIEPTPPGGATP